MEKLTERDIKRRLGLKNRHDGSNDKVPIRSQKPEFTITGTAVPSSPIVKGLGRYHFIIYPNRTYRPTDEELKPFLDYIKKDTVTNGIPPTTDTPTTTTKKGSGA